MCVEHAAAPKLKKLAHAHDICRRYPAGSQAPHRDSLATRRLTQVSGRGDLAGPTHCVGSHVGRRFVFNDGEDTDDDGERAEMMFTGAVVKDPEWGFLAVCDSDGLQWRRIPKPEEADAAIVLRRL